MQGDLFPVGKDGHRLLHYQVMMANGQGINRSDADSRKDFMGTIQVQPVKGLTIGLFGWTGTFCADNGVCVSRNRYLVGLKYDRHDWKVRAEYAHSVGHKVSDYDEQTGQWGGTARADAWYVSAGVPCTRWLTTYVKYDAYRDQGTWGTLKTIYSLAPNFLLHKNLILQPQLNYVHDRTISKSDYAELMMEMYVRF